MFFEPLIVKATAHRAIARAAVQLVSSTDTQNNDSIN
jgi:hypothetical protein